MIDQSLFEGTGLEQLMNFLTSLGIGLLIGLERERSPAAKAGLRTFALVAMFGTLAAFVSDRAASPWLLGAGLLAVGAMIIAAYLQHKPDDGDPGTTTVAALLTCYGLGALVWFGFSTIAVMVAIVTTILLYFKAELHGITRSLTRRDLVSMLQFAVLSFIVLPILPDRNFGPYGALNPYQVWLMVVLISGVSLAGYLALRAIGERHGAPLLGLFGGLVSSTATTLVYARNGRDNPAPAAFRGRRFAACDLTFRCGHGVAPFVWIDYWRQSDYQRRVGTSFRNRKGPGAVNWFGARSGAFALGG